MDFSQNNCRKICENLKNNSIIRFFSTQHCQVSNKNMARVHFLASWCYHQVILTYSVDIWLLCSNIKRDVRQLYLKNNVKRLHICSLKTLGDSLRTNFVNKNNVWWEMNEFHLKSSTNKTVSHSMKYHVCISVIANKSHFVRLFKFVVGSMEKDIVKLFWWIVCLNHFPQFTV